MEVKSVSIKLFSALFYGVRTLQHRKYVFGRSVLASEAILAED